MVREAETSVSRIAIFRKCVLASSGRITGGLGENILFSLLRSRRIFLGFDSPLIEVRKFLARISLYFSSGFALWIFDGNFGAPLVRFNGHSAVGI
jgi:hypothetical protein